MESNLENQESLIYGIQKRQKGVLENEDINLFNKDTYTVNQKLFSSEFEQSNFQYKKKNLQTDDQKFQSTYYNTKTDGSDQSSSDVESESENQKLSAGDNNHQQPKLSYKQKEYLKKLTIQYNSFQQFYQQIDNSDLFLPNEKRYARKRIRDFWYYKENKQKQTIINDDILNKDSKLYLLSQMSSKDKQIFKLQLKQNQSDSSFIENAYFQYCKDSTYQMEKYINNPKEKSQYEKIKNYPIQIQVFSFLSLCAQPQVLHNLFKQETYEILQNIFYSLIKYHNIAAFLPQENVSNFALQYIEFIISENTIKSFPKIEIEVLLQILSFNSLKQLLKYIYESQQQEMIEETKQFLKAKYQIDIKVVIYILKNVSLVNEEFFSIVQRINSKYFFKFGVYIGYEKFTAQQFNRLNQIILSFKQQIKILLTQLKPHTIKKYQGNLSEFFQFVNQLLSDNQAQKLFEFFKLNTKIKQQQMIKEEFSKKIESLIKPNTVQIQYINEEIQKIMEETDKIDPFGEKSITNHKLYSVAVKMHEEYPNYIIDYYHILIAATMIKQKKYLISLPTGQGKTFIISLISKYFEMFEFSQSAVVITSHKELKDQFNTMKESIDALGFINVFTLKEFFLEFQDINWPTLLLIDEVEETLSQDIYFQIAQNKLAFIYDLQNIEYIYSFTASSLSELNLFCQKILGMGNNSYKPFHTLNNNQQLLKIENQINCLNISSQDMILKKCLEIVQDKYNISPILIFAKNPLYQQVLKKLTTSKIQQYEIFQFKNDFLTQDERQAQIMQLKQKSNGICLIFGEEFGRGFDFRFAKDSYGIILFKPSNFSNLMQIFGRTSRLRGICSGSWICENASQELIQSMKNIDSRKLREIKELCMIFKNCKKNIFKQLKGVNYKNLEQIKKENRVLAKILGI